jgi:hypothetical protein
LTPESVEANVVRSIRDTPNGMEVDKMWQFLYDAPAPDFVQIWYFMYGFSATPTKPVLLENL